MWWTRHLINNRDKTIHLDACNAMRLFINGCAQCNQIIYQCFRLHLCLLYLKPPRELHVDNILKYLYHTLLFSKGSWFRTVSFPDTSPCYLFDKCSISINYGMTERRWNLFDEFIYFKIKWNLFDKTLFWRHKQTYTLAQMTFSKGFLGFSRDLQVDLASLWKC